MPPFATVEREVELKTDRAGVMRRLAENAGENAVFGRGVLFTSEKGTVSVTPCFDREAIRIVSSARREELAKDLCGQYERRTRELEEKAGRE